MNAARGVALGALVRRRRRGRRAAPAGRRRQHLQAALRERRPARQGRRRAGRRPAHRLGAQDRRSPTTTRPRSRSRSQDGYAPLHEGTTALDPRDLAVGHRQPLHRADAGPELQPASSTDGATLGTDKTTSIVDLDQLFNTLDPKTRAALQQVIQGNAQWYDNRGVQANAATKYFNPALSAHAPAGQRGRRRPADAQRLPAQRGQDDGRARLAPRRPREPRLQREHDRGRDRRRERVVQPGARRCCPARCARPTRRSSTCARRSTTSTCSSPRPSRRRRTSRRFLSELRPLVQEARPTISDLNTLVHRSGPNNDLTDLLGKAPALEKAAKPSFAHSIAALQQATPVIKFIRPYTPDFIGWLRDFGVGSAQLRRQRPLRADLADLQRLLVQPEHEPADADPAQPAAGRPADRPDPALPRRRLAGAGGRLGALPRRRRHAGLRPQPRAPRPMKRLLAIASCSLAAAVLVVLRHGRERRRRRLPRAGDLHERLLGHPRRGREDRRGQGRQDRVARRHARPQGRGRAAHRPRPASTTSARTPSARSARSRSSARSSSSARPRSRGPRTPSRRRSCARSSAGAGKGQYLLPVTQTSKPVDLDLVNNTLRLPYRERLTIIINELGTGLAGRGGDLRLAIRNADPALKETDKVLRILADQNRTLANLARDSDVILAPLARDRAKVATSSRRPRSRAQATAERSSALEQNIAKLPAFLRELTPTMQSLGAFADQATPVFTGLGKEAPSINRFIEELGPVLHGGDPGVPVPGRRRRRRRSCADQEQADHHRRRSARREREAADHQPRVAADLAEDHRRDRAPDGLPLLPSGARSTASIPTATTCAPVSSSTRARSTRSRAPPTAWRRSATARGSARAASAESVPGYADTRRSASLRQLDAFFHGKTLQLPTQSASKDGAASKATAPQAPAPRRRRRRRPRRPPAPAATTPAPAATTPAPGATTPTAADQAQGSDPSSSLLDYLLGSDG